MLKGFREFVLRGNVVDLAVGVVIGAAFTTVVNAFSGGFINPLIKAVTRGGARVGGTFTVNGAVFDYGTFVTAILNFLIVAAILYFLVVAPINRVNDYFKRGEKPAPPEPSNQERLLAEIRDELRRRPG